VLFSISYVFNQARHIWDLTNVNQFYQAAPGQAPTIPFPDFRVNQSVPPSQTSPTYIEWLDSGGNSNYNGLQMSVEKRLSNNINFVSSFTWSKALSQDSDFEAGLHGIQDRYQRNLEWGYWDNDTPLRFVNSFTYLLPVGKGQRYANTGAAGKILGNWKLNGIVTYASGQPIVIGIPYDSSELGSSRPDCVAAPGGFQKTINSWLNPAAYAMPSLYYWGDCSPTPGPRAPGISTWDTSIFREFPITESKRVEFRAEFFNTWNTPQFGSPSATILQPSFGQISSLALAPRQTQFALKFYF
jgi:hypothetical protein